MKSTEISDLVNATINNLGRTVLTRITRKVECVQCGKECIGFDVSDAGLCTDCCPCELCVLRRYMRDKREKK